MQKFLSLILIVGHVMRSICLSHMHFSSIKISVPSFGRQKIPCPDITLIFCLCYVHSLFAAHGVGK